MIPLLGLHEFARIAHRSQETHEATRLLHRILKETNQQPDEDLRRFPNKEASVPVELGAQQGGTGKHSDSPTWKLSETPPPLGFLRRLYDTGMTE